MITHHFIVLLALCCITSFADVVTVHNPKEFANLVNDRVSNGDFSFDIVLETDLDFEDGDLMGIIDKLPLGRIDDSNYVAYNGTFDGQGHVVKNLQLNGAGRICSGFIYIVSGAVFKGLKFDDSCVFGGENVGVIAVFFEGDVLVQKVEVNAKIEAEIICGGMLGQAIDTDGVSVTIENSIFRGSIFHDGDIKETPHYGGFIGSIDSSANLQVRLERNENHGVVFAAFKFDSNKYPDFFVGGCIGAILQASDAVITVVDNSNDVQMNITTKNYVGFIIGGFIGGFSGTNVVLTVKSNINHAHFYASSKDNIQVGGCIGSLYITNISMLLKDNNNDGDAFVTSTEAVSDVAGFIGYAYATEGNGFIFQSNTDKMVTYASPKDASCIYFSGIVGFFASFKTSHNLFYDNIYNGFVNMTGSCHSVCGGSVAAYIVTSEVGIYDPVSVEVVNNTNNGYAFFSVLDALNKYQTSFGGFIGYYYSKQKDVVSIENNINNGSFEGLIRSINFFAGGIIGQVSSPASFRICGNKNNGAINAICGVNGFIGGVVGYFPQSSDVNMTDNANYGSLRGTGAENRTTACGIICGSDSPSKIVIKNCVNNGTVTGTHAYGISNWVNSANNIVSVGTVNGLNATYSFWSNASGVVTSLYAISGSCNKCDENVTMIKKSQSDGRYRTIESNELVCELLNREAEENGYSLRWDENLFVRKPIILQIIGPVNLSINVLSGLTLEENGVSEEVFKYHLMKEGTNPSESNEFKKTSVIEDDIVLVPYYMITIEEMNKVLYVNAEKEHTVAASADVLNKYFSSKEYVVGDMDSNSVLQKSTIINGDLDIVVMKRNGIVMDMEAKTVLSSEYSPKEIAQEISALTGIGLDNILIQVEVDSEGYITRIVVILKEKDMPNTVAKAITDLEKDKQCKYKVLCRVHEVRVIVEEQSLDISQRNSIPIVFVVFFLIASSLMV